MICHSVNYVLFTALAAFSEEFSKQKPRNHNVNHKNLYLQVKGQVSFGITISSRHRMDLASGLCVLNVIYLCNKFYKKIYVDALCRYGK